MPKLNLSADEVLTTTRAVRKRLDFDRPVELSVIRECLELALQSPTGSMSQSWQFMLVDDPAQKAALAALYKRGWDGYVDQPYSILNLHQGTDMADAAGRAADSAAYLAEHMARAPWLVIPLVAGRYEGADAAMIAGVYGSILPAVWSFMLAARERALGTCWTTIHVVYEKESAEILGIPYAEYTQVAMIPVAYTKGTDFRAAPRRNVDQFIHRNRW